MAIRKFFLSVDTFAKVFMMPHWRSASIRLAGWKALASPLKTILTEFKIWRDAAITRANVTCETISIEWYLNSLFDPVSKRIYITTNDGGGVPMGLRATEPANKVALGLRASEPANKVPMGLRGEDPVLGFYSFGVFLPASLNGLQPAIRAELQFHRFAGKTFIFVNY